MTVKYLHASLGYPTKSTLLKAIKNGNLLTFPGLTVGAVQRHFPESDETQKGHMKAQRQGVRSTKEKDTDENNEEVQRPIAKKKDVC
jgi:hypothetical protein